MRVKRRAAREASMAPVFAALGDPIRLGVVTYLTTHGDSTATVLTTRTAVTRQALTKHLRVLERARLVTSTRRGRERLWSLRAEAVNDARAYLDAVATQWEAALGRLKEFVEVAG